MWIARANRLFYQLLLFVAYPVVRLRLKLRARREPEYGVRVDERFGYVPADVPKGAIWFHTVSAGETIAAAPLIEAVVEAFPETDVLVTTTTPTGSGEVRRLLGSRVAHCYAPYDFRRGVRRFYEAAQPRALVLMETELWPNLLAEAQAHGIPAYLVNARLSERSARGYRRVRALSAWMLNSLKGIACQSPRHKSRLVTVGADPERVVVTGSIKFDASLSSTIRAEAQALAEAWQLVQRRVWIAASTHPGEDELVLAAARQVAEQVDNVCLLLVPRHPHRAEDVMALALSQGFSAGLMSATDTGPLGDVVVGDQMGTLLKLYGLSEVAFVGGSLSDNGGHNPIEAALWGQPILMGPFIHNFVEVVDAFETTDALRIVDDADQLAEGVIGALLQSDVSAQRGARGEEVVAQNSGALQRLTDYLVRELTVVVS